LGGEYMNKKVGNCEYSHMAIFSFHPVKMITTGEGGAVMTNDKELDGMVSLLRSHGITKDINQFKNESDGDWYYEQQALGFNYRLTDIQAALGVSQLKRLDDFVAKRRKIAERYLNKLEGEILPYQHPDTNSSWHLFVIKTKNRKALFEHLKRNGVMSQIHYIPINAQPFYDRKKLKNSEEYYQHCLSVPIYFDLNSKEQEKIIKIL
jgi:dTDP-4-amino-4,6-dideoxygalactose transaminase